MEKRRGEKITQAWDCDFALSVDMEVQMGIKVERAVTMGSIEARLLMLSECPRWKGELG